MWKDFWRLPFFWSLALLEISIEPIMAFDDFLNWDFNLTKQRKCIEKKIFSDEEMKYLLYIYNLMNDLYVRKGKEHDKWKINIWKDWSLKDKEVLEIKKWIIKFLSLDSMKKDMNIIRCNPNYKWIWDFY